MTKVSELQARQGKVELVGTITKLDEARSFDKFGKAGKVANAKIRDETGEVTLTLWNEQCDQVKVGDKVAVHNGWVSEYRGELQLSTGKFGSLEMMGAGEVHAQPAAPVKPAAPVHQPAAPSKPSPKLDEDEVDDTLEEEVVEDDVVDE